MNNNKYKINIIPPTKNRNVSFLKREKLKRMQSIINEFVKT